ncbi:MAG: CHAT domain-containing protein [Thermoanaerobaculia bacterium]|nr:CHAT domain-containing protein [Thermoanaerobaculia bacterium]
MPAKLFDAEQELARKRALNQKALAAFDLGEQALEPKHFELAAAHFLELASLHGADSAVSGAVAKMNGAKALAKLAELGIEREKNYRLAAAMYGEAANVFAESQDWADTQLGAWCELSRAGSLMTLASLGIDRQQHVASALTLYEKAVPAVTENAPFYLDALLQWVAALNIAADLGGETRKHLKSAGALLVKAETYVDERGAPVPAFLVESASFMLAVVSHGLCPKNRAKKFLSVALEHAQQAAMHSADIHTAAQSHRLVSTAALYLAEHEDQPSKFHALAKSSSKLAASLFGPRVRDGALSMVDLATVLILSDSQSQSLTNLEEALSLYERAAGVLEKQTLEGANCRLLWARALWLSLSQGAPQSQDRLLLGVRLLREVSSTVAPLHPVGAQALSLASLILEESVDAVRVGGLAAGPLFGEVVTALAPLGDPIERVLGLPLTDMQLRMAQALAAAHRSWLTLCLTDPECPSTEVWRVAELGRRYRVRGQQGPLPGGFLDPLKEGVTKVLDLREKITRRFTVHEPPPKKGGRRLSSRSRDEDLWNQTASGLLGHQDLRRVDDALLAAYSATIENLRREVMYLPGAVRYLDAEAFDPIAIRSALRSLASRAGAGTAWFLGLSRVEVHGGAAFQLIALGGPEDGKERVGWLELPEEGNPALLVAPELSDVAARLRVPASVSAGARTIRHCPLDVDYGRFLTQLGHTLLEGPLADLKDAGHPELLVACDMELGGVPVRAALELAGRGDIGVIHLPHAFSALDLVRRRKVPARSGLLAIGSPPDPAWSGREVEQLVQRTWSNQPGRETAFSARSVTTHLGVEALLNEARGAEIVHLGLHCQFDPENILGSGFLLPGGEKLTVGRVALASRDAFEGVRLVFCNGCSSSRLSSQDVSSIGGFAFAMFAAGVEGVIATLWPVADDLAVDVARAFYDALWPTQAGTPALPAHRALALAVRRARQLHPRWSDPRFWAPWVFLGRPSCQPRDGVDC